MEAIYFDLNSTHLFIIVVTSVPFYKQWGGEWGVGVKEARWTVPNNWVRPGDLCLDLNVSVPRVELFGTWSYDYGIDLVHENRDNKYPLNYGNTYMRDNDLGSALYKTVADPGGESIQDPGYGYDWYTASWFSPANWKHTNFDPLSILSSSTLEKMGDETDGIITNYYQYEFKGEWAGYEENNADTWVIEATIPIHLFKEGDWPPPGGTMGIQWISSCRNDAPVIAQLEVILPTQLGDFVWDDLDADGIQDGGEPGIEGVTVNLCDESLLVLNSQVTDDSGRYLFSNLPPGEYCIQVEAPDGFSFTSQDVGDDDTIDSDVDGVSGVSGLVVLTSGMTDVTLDAGLYQMASLGDFVWDDLDADGIQDLGELGLRDATVNLYYAHNDTLAATTTTTATGYYLFTNLVPDTYYLDFILPSGYLFSPGNQGSDDTVDSDADTSLGTTPGFILMSGETDLTWDTGGYMNSFLGDFVWDDRDTDGFQDSREDGLESIEVFLYTHDGTLVGSTLTNTMGYYQFLNISPGIYYLRFMLPPRYEYSPQDKGDNDALDSDANFLGFTDLITLLSNTSDRSWDCGMFSGAKRIIPPPYIDEQGIEYVTNTTRIFLNFTGGTLNKTFFRVWKWDTEITDWYLLFDWLSADEALNHTPPLYPIDLCTIGDFFNVGCCGYYELDYYYDNLTVMYWNDIYVDCTPPVTTKTYGVPNSPDTRDPLHVHWITPQTSINLTALDSLYESGLNAIYYRVYYHNQTLYTIPDEDTWTLYRGNFTIQGRQGVYQIDYYSVDNVGNTESFVTQTAILGCPWDLNDDGTVNILDVIRIVNHLGETGPPWWIPEDLAGGGPQGIPDGEINILDIISAANHWGACSLAYP